MDTIKWLHLSDLHFGSNADSREKIRESLLQFIKKNKWKIDYLFITGDLIFAPETSDDTTRESAYNNAYEYIDKLCQAIWHNEKKYNKWERVFIVPGNHDVIRNKSRESKISGILKNYIENGHEKIDESFEEDFCSGIKDYLKHMPDDRHKEQSKASSATHYIISTKKINILHINSCITSGKDKEDGNLILGSQLLEQQLKEKDDSIPTIAISHHNIDCLERTEQKKVELILKQNNIFLFLCGHTHARESNFILRYNQLKILNTFTSGALMSEDGKYDVVILRGELDSAKSEGSIYSYKWLDEHGWTEDSDFGLTQGKKGNVRSFWGGDILGPAFSQIQEKEPRKNQKGVLSIIVKHTSVERQRAFLEVNEHAKTSLSVYGIGITHISKNQDLMKQILMSGGSIRLCMMDPKVFKDGECKKLFIENQTNSSLDVRVDSCDLNQLNFCIGMQHMDKYIRNEYADDVKKSYERIKKFEEEIKDKKWNFKIRLLRSFVPISINIVNEKDEDAELIAEYNMPFVEKRLLLQLKQKQNMNYFNELIGVFEEIWDRSIEE